MVTLKLDLESELCIIRQSKTLLLAPDNEYIFLNYEIYGEIKMVE